MPAQDNDRQHSSPLSSARTGYITPVQPAEAPGLPPLPDLPAAPSKQQAQRGLHPFADAAEPLQPAGAAPAALPVSRAARHVQLLEEPSVRDVPELPERRETWKDKVMRALKYRVRRTCWALGELLAGGHGAVVGGACASAPARQQVGNTACQAHGRSCSAAEAGGCKPARQ